jgi:hypothetical protein
MRWRRILWGATPEDWLQITISWRFWIYIENDFQVGPVGWGTYFHGENQNKISFDTVPLRTSEVHEKFQDKFVKAYSIIPLWVHLVWWDGPFKVLQCAHIYVRFYPELHVQCHDGNKKVLWTVARLLFWNWQPYC